MSPAEIPDDWVRGPSMLLLLARRENGVTTYHSMPVEAIDEVEHIIPDGGAGVEVRAYIGVCWEVAQ